MIRESIVLIPPTSVDWQGDPTGAAGSPVTVEGCKVWPRTGTEDASRGSIVIEGLSVWIPSTQVEITALHKVKARGEVFTVEGFPGYYTGKGILVALEKVGRKPAGA